MILSNEEKDKFVAYCKTQIDSLTEIIKQLEKLPVYVTEVAKAKKVELLAYSIVYKDLIKLETVTIGD